MTFNSAIFLVFGAGFFGLWPLCRSNARMRYVFITAASLFFYGWWDWRFVPLLVGTGMVDFYAARLMQRYEERRRFFLVASMVSNLGVLAVFKYFNFFSQSIATALAEMGMAVSLPTLHIVLPLGISFYTFASMSYTIDVYRRELTPYSDVWHFLAFLSLFCHLVAGPVLRAANLMPQMAVVTPVGEEDRWEGFKLIVAGFFKKVVVADNLALPVDTAFSGTVSGGGIFWWCVMLMFAFQIYCDFSGYSDIARGLARWMGYQFALNFNHPYAASGIKDFWSRWHISLSTWFRDYVYIPLGGGRGGVSAGIRNMWITMLLSGLWHGANWTFLVWGAWHAAFLTLERLTDWPRRLQQLGAGGRAAAWAATLTIVLMSWVFFRAESIGQAGAIFAGMARWDDWRLPISAAPLIFLAGGILFELAAYWRVGRLLPREGWAAWLRPATLAGLICACVFLRGTGHTFIYFNF